MRRSRITVIAALAASALALSACSSDTLNGGESTAPGTDAGAGADGELIPVTVGLLQIATSSAVPLGIEEGIFAKHGLDVSIQLGQGGAALLPAVSSGSIEFAVGNPLSVLVAASQGLEMEIIAGFSTSYENIDDPEDLAPSGTVVRADSGITRWKDLEGKTVAVNTLNTIGDLTIMSAVDADGGDSSLVSFTEIAFPDQLAQLEQGFIDAAWFPEPFLSTARGDEAISFLGDSLREIDGVYAMVTFTSSAYAEANPEVVRAFAAAVTESAELAMADDAKFRAAISDFTGMPLEVAEAINLEYISGSLDRDVLAELSAKAFKYGHLDSEPDLDAVIFE